MQNIFGCPISESVLTSSESAMTFNHTEQAFFATTTSSEFKQNINSFDDITCSIEQPFRLNWQSVNGLPNISS